MWLLWLICLWAVASVIQSFKPSLWMHSWLLAAILTDGAARASLLSAMMSCHLASAPSVVLQAVVNHYPSHSLYPGASLSSQPAGRTLKALLLVGTLSWSSFILSKRFHISNKQTNKKVNLKPPFAIWHDWGNRSPEMCLLVWTMNDSFNTGSYSSGFSSCGWFQAENPSVVESTRRMITAVDG